MCSSSGAAACTPPFPPRGSVLPQAETPVAIFTYRRPEHAERALASVAACDGLGAARIVIYCDGPRGSDDHAAVEATRAVVRRWSLQLAAEVVERPANLGVAHSIVGGVTELCERFGRVVVVEDDLSVHPAFVRFMMQALDRYEDEPQVFQVSGFMFNVDPGPGPDAFLLPLTTTWGWATWARAWRTFEWAPPDAKEALADSNLCKRFDLDGSYPFSAMLQDRLAGRNDSWGILWWWAVFRRNGLVLYPRRSLVRNLGFDNSGAHCGPGYDLGSAASFSPDPWHTGARLPEGLHPDWDTLRKVAMFLKTQSQPGRMAALWRRLRVLIRGQRPPAASTPCR